MCEQDSRLLRCFAAVFPLLRAEEILDGNTESADSWDSLSAVTLSAAVQEEFGVDIEPEVLPTLRSFAAYRTYLRQLSPSGR
jgi:acyl carrier protein